MKLTLFKWIQKRVFGVGQMETQQQESYVFLIVAIPEWTWLWIRQIATKKFRIINSKLLQIFVATFEWFIQKAWVWLGPAKVRIFWEILKFLPYTYMYCHVLWCLHILSKWYTYRYVPPRSQTAGFQTQESRVFLIVNHNVVDAVWDNTDQVFKLDLSPIKWW